MVSLSVIANPGPPPAPVVVEGVPLIARTLLLVEPLPALAMAVTEALQGYGQRTVSVRSMEDALALARVIQFDLVLAHLGRAGRAADESVAALRSECTCPLMVLVDACLPDARLARLREAVDDLVQLPVGTSELAERLARLTREGVARKEPIGRAVTERTLSGPAGITWRAVTMVPSSRTMTPAPTPPASALCASPSVSMRTRDGRMRW